LVIVELSATQIAMGGQMKSTIPTPNSALDSRGCAIATPRVAKPTELDSAPGLVDLGALGRRLEGLTDQRERRGKRYALPMLLLLVVLAKLSGEDRPAGIADWVAGRGAQLREALGLAWKRMPHESTFRRLFEWMVSPDELDEEFGQYLRSQPGVGKSVLISIDGKAVRGTIRWGESRGEHLLAAYLPEEGIVLMQVAAGDKDNEINAAPVLLRALDLRGDLRGKVVVGDAIHTQRALSVQILEAEADYLWFVKENQPTLHEDIATLFEADRQTVLGGVIEDDFQTFRTVEKSHGRIESRAITVSGELKGYSDWPGLEQVFRLERKRVEYRDGNQETEVVYGLTSLSREEALPERLLALTRAYWGIENGLHRRRDVTFEEDSTRLTRGKAGRVMASINNLVISLLRLSGHTNLAAARRQWDAKLTLALGRSSASLLT
jgi:predicted transposase YbfD/YdcC